jgi:hypothetical protein
LLVYNNYAYIKLYTADIIITMFISEVLI